MRRKNNSISKNGTYPSAGTRIGGTQSRDEKLPSILPFPEIRTGVKSIRRYRRPGYYIIPPSDINVRRVEIAAVKNRDLRDFLYYRLRSLYPGNSDLTAFDYLLPEAGGERDALLCICRSDVLNQHRVAARGRQIAVPLSLLMPVIAAYREAKLAFLYFGDASVEIDLFEKNHLASSTVFARGQDGRTDAAELKALCGRFGAGEVYCVIEKREDVTAFRICEELFHDPGHLKISDLSSALKALGRHDPLFQISRKKSNARTRVASAILITLALSLGVLNVNKAVQRERMFSAHLDAELASVRQQAEHTVRLENELAVLRAKVEELTRRPFAQPYVVLSELGVILGGRARIDSFFIEGNFFQIDAVSLDPLVLMQRFEKHPHFRNLRITQVVPEGNTDRRRFTLTGEYDVD